MSRSQLTVSIYRNGDHVAGLLQQLYKQGLLRTASSETGTGKTKKKSTQGTGRGNASAKADVPVVAAAELALAGDLALGLDREDRHDHKQVFAYEYTADYYLDLVRHHLRTQDLIRSVASIKRARKLQVGDWVEFQASFTANQLVAILDILTPEMAAEVARYRKRREALEGFDLLHKLEAPNYQDKVAAYQIRSQMAETAAADLAAAVTSAIRADFRGEPTREYYATIPTEDDEESLTAIIVCEADCFLTRDPDRLLDGNFTVLGKVGSLVQRNAPVLARNKLLNQLAPEFVDEAVSQLQQAVQTPTENLQQAQREAAQAVLDLKLNSRIDGSSFTVIPIAVFV